MTPTLKNLVSEIRALTLMYAEGNMPTVKRKEFRELMGYVSVETMFLSRAEREKIIEEVFAMWEVKD